jgi:altronate dehydratase
MRALCLGGMKESTQQQIEIQETCLFGLIKLIEYLYTKQFDMEDVNGDNIVELLIVSDKYGCFKLKDQIERLISNGLTNENVSGLLVISDRHNADNLKKACFEYIRQHYSQVIQTSEYREIQSEVENILNNNIHNSNSNNHNNEDEKRIASTQNMINSNTNISPISRAEKKPGDFFNFHSSHISIHFVTFFQFF